MQQKYSESTIKIKPRSPDDYDTGFSFFVHDVKKLEQYVKRHQWKILTIRCGTLNDLSPLRQLNRLRELSILFMENLENVSGIESLKTLKKLSLIESAIKDIRAISHLENLENLCLDNNKIEDLSPLAHLKNLTSLSLCEGKIQSLKPLARLQNLKSLGIDLTPNRIEPLSALTNLEHLCLVRVGRITTLKHLKNLTSLVLWRGYFGSLNALSSLTHLKRLVLNAYGAKNLHALSSLQELQKLSLNFMQSLRDWNGISDLKNLTELDLSNSTVNDLEKIKPAKSVKHLRFFDGSAKDFSFLSRFPHLASLCIGRIHSRKYDISFISELKELEEVHLRFHQNMDIKPLLHLPKLKTVSVSEKAKIDSKTFQALKEKGINVS